MNFYNLIMRSTASWEVSTGAEECEEIWHEEKGVGETGSDRRQWALGH